MVCPNLRHDSDYLCSFPEASASSSCSASRRPACTGLPRLTSGPPPRAPGHLTVPWVAGSSWVAAARVLPHFALTPPTLSWPAACPPAAPADATRPTAPACPRHPPTARGAGTQGASEERLFQTHLRCVPDPVRSPVRVAVGGLCRRGSRGAWGGPGPGRKCMLKARSQGSNCSQGSNRRALPLLLSSR